MDHAASLKRTLSRNYWMKGTRCQSPRGGQMQVLIITGVALKPARKEQCSMTVCIEQKSGVKQTEARMRSRRRNPGRARLLEHSRCSEKKNPRSANQGSEQITMSF
jgi:hypothetical protein